VRPSLSGMDAPRATAASPSEKSGFLGIPQSNSCGANLTQELRQSHAGSKSTTRTGVGSGGFVRVPQAPCDTDPVDGTLSTLHRFTPRNGGFEGYRAPLPEAQPCEMNIELVPSIVRV
jgi:hypothetical protein